MKTVGLKMKKYKLLKDLPEMKAGAIYIWNDKCSAYVPQDNYTRIESRDWVYHNSYEKETVENSTGWFAPINSHPSKEEIIREYKVDEANNYTYSDVTRIMDAHAESIKEQLVEKIAIMGIYNNPNEQTLKSEIIELIKNFKSE